MKILKSAAIAALLLPMNVGAIEFYTFHEQCALGEIDTYTGTNADVVSVLNWSVEAMDYGPDGKLYASVESGCFTHGSADTLATIDPTTGQVDIIGRFYPGEDPADVDAIAFSPAGELFAVAIGPYELVKINPATGVATTIGHIEGTDGRFLGAIEFLPDGTLLCIDMAEAGGGPSHLWKIDTATAEATSIGWLGFNSVEGMTLGPDGKLYALANSMEPDVDAILVEVDSATGAGTSVQDVTLGGPRDALVAKPAVLIDIDVKPGSDPNCFNINDAGVVPVAILGSALLDVTQIDPESLRFGGMSVRVRGQRGPLCSIKSYEGDAYADMICQFADDSSAWEPGSGTATLKGNTFSGTVLEGNDSICVRPVP
jgi:hypothetical protein